MVETGTEVDVGNSAWERAEAHRKAQHYALAGKVFHEMWTARKNPAAGWRYAFCLRKAGYAEAALRVIRLVLNHASDHEGARREHVWILYDCHLKPAVQLEQDDKVIQAARAMMEAGAQGLARQIALFAAVKSARRKGHWSQVAALCEQIDPSTLSKEPGSFQKRRLPSPQERWYFARIKAMIELKEWEAAYACCVQSLQLFPGTYDFTRWQASALVGLARVPEAVTLLEGLRARRPTWYALADLAVAYGLEDKVENAWSTGLAALRQPGEEKAKVTLLLFLAETALQKGDPQAAGVLSGWCAAIRRAEGWPVRGRLVELHHKLAVGSGDGNWEDPVPEWRQRWRTLEASRGGEPRAGSVAPSDAQRRPGIGTGYGDGKKFAFIREPGRKEPMFVLCQELPVEARRNDARVSFQTVASFDRKKNRASERAVQVRSETKKAE